MPSHAGRSWPASTSRTLLILALTVCLLAMHSLMGTLPPSDASEMGTVVTAPTATSALLDHAASLSGDRSGSGSMSISAMEDCAAVIDASGLPLVSAPILGITLHLSEPAVRGTAVMSDPPRPPTPHAIGVLRI